MSAQRDRLLAAMADLRAQRGALGDATVDAALASMQVALDAMDGAGSGPVLRQVSILFLDVVGSTALADGLDAEDIQAVMDGLLSRCTAVVNAHGGKVLQYAGDSLLAAFGAEAVREDDAERAVRAGLALLGEGRATAQRVLRQHGHAGFDVRVGVHTGDVLLGGGVNAEASIRGSPVNLAARMEQSAPPGTLRISAATHALVRGLFDVQAQPPLRVKGLDAEQTTYLVRAAKPRSFRAASRGIEGVATRMVARDAELQRLQRAFEGLRDAPRLQRVVVAGEAGIGKSRLLHEFQGWLQTRHPGSRLLQARAQPQTPPFGLLRDMLAGWWRIADDDSMAAARAKLEQGMAELHGAELETAQAHLLGHLIGLDYTDSPHLRGIGNDSPQLRQRGFDAAARALRRLCATAGAPPVLMLDDLHWADEGSLDFLDHLTRSHPDLPLLLLALARPSFFDGRTRWAVPDPALLRIELLPLGAAERSELAGELLRKLPRVPESLRELVTATAEGNPFYMEELVKMFIDDGAIDAAGEHWSVDAQRLGSARIPQTLKGVLQARLDGLEPAHRLALQQASVLGAAFEESALAALDGAAVRALPWLVRRQLLRPQRGGGDEANGREFAFSHALLHQVTYDTLLRRSRRELHLRAGRWLAATAGERANLQLDATAAHFDQGGDTLQACHYYALAAEHAAGRFAHQSAHAQATRALQLLERAAPGDDDAAALRYRLLDLRERLLDLRGQREAQRQDIEALETLVRQLGDARLDAEVAWRRCDFALRTGDRALARTTAQRAMALAESCGNDELRLRSLNRLASAMHLQGDVEAGRSLATQGLDQARSLGLRRVESQLLNTLSIIAGMQEDHIASLQFGEQRLQIDRELGNQRGEAITLGNLGMQWLNLGQHALAKQHLQPALQLSRRVGDRGSEPYVLQCLAELALRDGDGEAACVLARESVAVATEVDSPESLISGLIMLANAELALRRTTEAQAGFERARSIALACGDALHRDATAGLARVALARGDATAALQIIEPLLVHLAGGGTLAGSEGPRTIELTCHRALRLAGDARADDLLAAAHRALQAHCARIGDAALRCSYIEAIPEHRDIAAAWAERQGVAAGTP